MKFNNNILIDRKRFKVPIGYFNTLSTDLTEKKDIKSNRFKVPEKYFENLDKQEIFNRIYISKIKTFKINLYRTASIAAMFIFVFYSPPPKSGVLVFLGHRQPRRKTHKTTGK